MAQLSALGIIHALEFMTTPNKQNPIPKVVALILVTIGVALLMMRYDASALAKLDSMSAAEVVQYQRDLHHHTFLYHFVGYLIMGGFYLGVIEFMAYVIGLIIPKKPDA